MKSFFIALFFLGCHWLSTAQVTDYYTPSSQSKEKGESDKQLLSTSKVKSFISVVAAKQKLQQEEKKQSFLAFPEVRENPIQWFDSVRTEWVTSKYDLQHALTQRSTRRIPDLPSGRVGYRATSEEGAGEIL